MGPNGRACACPTRGRARPAAADPPAQLALERSVTASSASSQDGAAHTPTTPYDRNAVFERLITGQQSERGEAPPAYNTVVPVRSDAP